AAAPAAEAPRRVRSPGRSSRLTLPRRIGDIQAPRGGNEPMTDGAAPRGPGLWARAAILVLLVAGAIACVVAARRAPRPPPGPRTTTLEIVAVDDDAEIVADALPRGGSVAQEHAPLGPGQTAARNYVRVVRGEDESMDQARQRLLAW